MTLVNNCPTIFYEDNIACIAQVKRGYIKRDKPNHISPKFFVTHELQESRQIDVKQIGFTDNFANLVIKSLSISTFKN